MKTPRGTTIKIMPQIGKALDQLRRIRDRIPQYMAHALKDVAQLYAIEITKSAQRAAFSFPRPYLSRHIKHRLASKYSKRSVVYEVLLPYYAWAVEFGRRSGKMPPDTAKLRTWARRANVNYYYLRHSIAKHGTRGRPFIRNGIRNAHRQARKKFAKRIKNEINKGVKR